MKRMQFCMAWISTLVLLVGTTDLAGCGSKESVPAAAAAQQPVSAPAATTDQQAPQDAQAPTPDQVQQQNEAAAAQNPPQTQLPQVSLTADGLDELLAPIALYPDPVLAIMLQAAVNPQEVMDGGNWLTVGDNGKLKDAALDEATKKAGFTPVMMALLHFGPVVDMMCTQFDWTKQLGAAYAADPKAVLDSVQRLRAQAVDTGALKSSPQMTVDVKQDQGKQVVQLEPTDPKVVYVPQYNPDQVFGTTTTTTTANGVTTTTTTTTGAAGAPAPATSTNSTTVVKEKEGVSTGTAVLIGLLSFGAGMAVGAAINSNNYYYPAWGYGGVWYGPRPYYPPPYRPVYYGGWHGGYGYNRPVHYGNNNVNINVNNNYYNRFNNNNNLNPNYKPRPVPYNHNPNSNYAKSAGNYTGANRGVKYNGSSNYKEASTYQGNNRQPNTSNVQNRPGGANVGNTAAQRPAGGNAANNPNVQRPAARCGKQQLEGTIHLSRSEQSGGRQRGSKQSSEYREHADAKSLWRSRFWPARRNTSDHGKYAKLAPSYGQYPGSAPGHRQHAEHASCGKHATGSASRNATGQSASNSTTD